MLLVASSLLAPFVALVVQLSAVAGVPIAVRDPFISLPITKHINRDGNGTVDIVQADQTRLMNFASGVSGQSTLDATTGINVPVTNTGFAYTASIGVGNPPFNYNFIVDTGSANTWLGANQRYHETDSTKKTYDILTVKYGSGSVHGREYDDILTIAPGVTIQQSIGVARRSEGIYPFDGILGLGPKDLSSGTLFPHLKSSIWTVTDNLFRQGVTQQNLLAVSFDPTTSDTVTGELTFGSTDSTKYTGHINYVPVTSVYPSNLYWGLDLSFQYGHDGSTPIMATNAGILDSGTGLIYIAPDAYRRYVAATGAVHDDATGLLRITSGQYNSLKSLFFNIGGNTYEFTRNAQIFPRILNTALKGGDKDSIYLAIRKITDNTVGYQFILGKAFLERFYTVLDTGNAQIGIATTASTNAETN